MIRKLMLVGMLVVAGRGSVAQLFLALVISFVSFSLQVKLSPCECRTFSCIVSSCCLFWSTTFCTLTKRIHF